LPLFNSGHCKPAALHEHADADRLRHEHALDEPCEGVG
jgi:hypothetical protein